MLARQSQHERAAVATALSTGTLHVSWAPTVQPAGRGADPPAVAALRRQLERLHIDASRISVSSAPNAALEHSSDHDVSGVLSLSDGSALLFAASLDAPSGHQADAAVLSTTVMVLGVLLVSILLVRSISAPLRRLATAADSIGHTSSPTAIAETGPTEVRRVAHAFNGMQERIRRIVEDRTRALAAVSHDLRTPITRLRLRAGFIEDQEAQARVDADLDEMDSMIEATLAYLKGDADTEIRRATNLSSLIATLVDDLTDSGYDVGWEGPVDAVATIRPIAVKRALSNLLHNAVTYGTSAQLHLEARGANWRLLITDCGPGIAVADIPRALEPFQRFKHSRNRSTGGVGLGLTIAAQAVAAEGGNLSLRNLRDRGLEVEVLLPMAGPTSDT
jgi:signal transduction histidine kinase